MADDEPFYTPGKKPTQPPRYRPQSSEPLWEFRKNHVTWSGELPFHSESYGWEASTLRDGELVMSRRFVMRENAVRAESERTDLEKGR